MSQYEPPRLAARPFRGRLLSIGLAGPIGTLHLPYESQTPALHAFRRVPYTTVIPRMPPLSCGTPWTLRSAWTPSSDATCVNVAGPALAIRLKSTVAVQFFLSCAFSVARRIGSSARLTSRDSPAEATPRAAAHRDS